MVKILPIYNGYIYKGYLNLLKGSIFITLSKGGVRSWVGQEKPDAYAKIGIGGDERTTVVAKNSVQHTWDEWYEFPLEEVDGHVVEVNMYDRDKMSSDEFLGYAAIYIKTFSQVKHLFNRGTAAKQVHSGKQAGTSSGQLVSKQAVPTLAVSQPIQTR